MRSFVTWLTQNEELPCPIVAAVAHYQFATIHPFYDGNGRTARLLTTLVLHLGGYDLKGLYSLEEYYARNLAAYYRAISIGPSHNYYEGRSEADVTSWVEYFVEGMSSSFDSVLRQMAAHQSRPDQSAQLRQLDAKQRKALQLFEEFEVVTAKQVGDLFGYKPRTSSALCAAWVKVGFLKVIDRSKKARRYALIRKLQN